MTKEKHEEVMRLIANLPAAEDNIKKNKSSLVEAEKFFRKVIESRIDHFSEELFC